MKQRMTAASIALMGLSLTFKFANCLLLAKVSAFIALISAVYGVYLHRKGL